jgi:uncharacterized membrane protein YidH (DUF202 family)
MAPEAGGSVQQTKTPSTSINVSDSTIQQDSDPPTPPAQPRRQSSIRFADDTNITSRSPMSRPHRPSADEITPIRSAETSQPRNYNTGAGSDGPNQQNGAAGRGQEEDKLSWYKRLADKYGTVSLENKGSVARDHLALERTFLAWLRTSLAFASIGIAVTQLFRLNTTIASRQQNQGVSAVPFSPLVGQTLPVELLPYLQQLIAANAPAMQQLGPTLLDQLLLLPPMPDQPRLPPVHAKAFDERAAERLRHVGKPLGSTFLGISIVILLIGCHRYFESQYWIIRGKFPASRGSVFAVAFMAAALIIASLIVVLVIAPTSFEKK